MLFLKHSSMLMSDGCRLCLANIHRRSGVTNELCRLQGHRHDVLLLQVSHDSKAIATGSKDGCVRVSNARRSPHGIQSLPHIHA